MDNRLYWEQFYKDEHIKEPSDFAKTTNLRYRKMIDLGCGNGRDTLYFKSLGTGITGVDEFSPFGSDFINTKIEDFIKNDTVWGALYMRFLLHVIDENLEDDIFAWATQKVDYAIFIECRSDKGIVPDNNHYRRLINGEKLKLKIVSAGFDIKYFAEQTGFAEYKGEDPVIIRLVAKR